MKREHFSGAAAAMIAVVLSERNLFE
jgi:hypothetical protein